MTEAEIEMVANVAFLMRHHATTCAQRALATSREISAEWTGRSVAYRLCAADVEAVLEILDAGRKEGL